MHGRGAFTCLSDEEYTDDDDETDFVGCSATIPPLYQDSAVVIVVVAVGVRIGVDADGCAQKCSLLRQYGEQV